MKGVATVKRKTILKVCVDAAMFVLFLLLMSEFLLKDAHLWIGIDATALFTLHTALNYKWYKALFKGKYGAMRILQTAVNFLLLIDLIICIVSGILILPDIFIGYEINVKIHLLTSAWTFILMSVHLGLHWSMFVRMASKINIHEGVKTALRWIFRVVLCVILLYGVHVFVERRFWEEMFLLIDYQKTYDYSKSPVTYIAESIALSAVFVSATYYVKKISLTPRRKKEAE